MQRAKFRLVAIDFCNCLHRQGKHEMTVWCIYGEFTKRTRRGNGHERAGRNDGSAPAITKPEIGMHCATQSQAQHKIVRNRIGVLVRRQIEQGEL